MVELLLGDSRELDANADSHCEPTFNREQDPSRRASHPATCHALTWASVAGMSPERKAALARRHNDYALRVAPSAGVARGGVSAVFRAVLVPIDRISLLVTHLGVAVERAPAALLPPPIEPQRH
jgi:hypothetical protein